jgi:hypothetical protein
MKSHTVQKELWYFGGVEELLCAFCVSTSLAFLNTISTPAALCCSSQISENISKIISLSAANRKTRLKFSKSKQ